MGAPVMLRSTSQDTVDQLSGINKTARRLDREHRRKSHGVRGRQSCRSNGKAQGQAARGGASARERGPGGFTLALSGGASACAEEKAKSLASAAPAMFASGETG